MKWLRRIFGIKSPSEEMIKQVSGLSQEFIACYDVTQFSPELKELVRKSQRLAYIRAKTSKHKQRNKMNRARVRSGLM